MALTGLAQSLQSFIWGGGGGSLTGLVHSLQSYIWGVWRSLAWHNHCFRLSGGMVLTGLAQSLQSFFSGWGGMALTGLAQSLQSFIWGVCVDWLGTVTSVVYLVVCVDWLGSHFCRLSGGYVFTGLAVTSVVYLGGMC